MITTQNYYSTIQQTGISNLPEALRKSHEVISKMTNNGANWDTYNNNPTAKRVTDLYFKKLDEYLAANPIKEAPVKSVVKPVPRQEVLPVKEEIKSKISKSKKGKASKAAGTPIERLDDEVKFIKRYVGLDGKKKTDKQIMNFIDALQKAILERRIKKTSPYAPEIKSIQENLVRAYNKMIETKSYELTFNVAADTIEHLKTISESETPMLSVAFIKRYVGMDGRKATKEKVKGLYDQITHALEKGRITEADKYFDKLQAVKRGLFSFLNTKKPGILKIETAELNGLLSACGECQHYNHKVSAVSNGGLGVLTSLELSSQHFDTLSFQGKWHNLIGNPAQGFRILIYGNPKGGKSTLAIEFAKYLAEQHGKVLYEAIEEGFGATLQDKIHRLNATHPNLLFTDALKENLSGYDFVFIDSITKAAMNAEHIHNLHLKYPNTGFIFIAQSTKDGSYRGAKDLEHEVDTIIHVEKGTAKSYGRFNQGGQARVF